MNAFPLQDPDEPAAFSRNIWVSVLLVIALSIAFAVYVYQEKQIDHANDHRVRIVSLAAELRQSSDDLTSLSRSYVVTGKSEYRTRYQDILDIRDGKKPRLPSPFDFSGDATQTGTARPQRAIALLDLVREEGVTPEEMVRLELAKSRSDALAKVEAEAMQLRDDTSGIAPDPSAQDPATGPTAAPANPRANPAADPAAKAAASALESRRARAIDMLHGPAYMAAKAGIMQPIAEFYQMADQRTAARVHYFEELANIARFGFIALGLWLLLMLRGAYLALRRTLGGSLEDVHYRITRIGKGDFSLDQIDTRPTPADSVLRWLAQTRKNLAEIEAGRQAVEAKNQRLTRLYNALSQCNQSIVRCGSDLELFRQICRDVVNFGGIAMAWIGMIDTERKTLRAVASFGQGTAYQEGLTISIDEEQENGRGPSGIAVRENRPVWCQDFLADPSTLPWRERAREFGWRASAALPLRSDGRVVGLLSLYASEPNFFDDAARDLIVKLSLDLDDALTMLERKRQRDQAVAALADSRSLLKTIIDTVPLRVFWKDRNLRYMGCNPGFARDAQLSSPEEVIGKDDFQLVWGDQAERYRNDDRRVLESGQPRLFYEEPHRNPDGQTNWVRTSKVPLRGQDNELIGLLGIYEDITDQRQAQERIEYLANYDTLTGLANRSRLGVQLDYALSVARRNKSPLALMLLDLDDFKDINDAVGHSVGDALLVEVAKRLRHAVREEDTLARIGGDEFVLVLPDADAAGAAQVAQKILEAVAEPYRIHQYHLALSASIGVAMFPEDGSNIEALFKSADTAMYHAKRDGRRGFRFSTDAMQARSARNLELINAMHRALEAEEFELYFQPQMSLHDGQLVGAEALLRWRHPSLGPISPTEFIPLAEHSGLIMPLGELVLRQAVREARTWMHLSAAPIVVAVNLSVVQFRSADLPATIDRVLREERLPPERLELELTESVAMTNPENAIQVIHGLHARGIQMSIDDFGTGYSSLSYLKKLKIHKIKIDRSFVRDVLSDPEDKAIVAAIIQVARQLGLKTVAEGVESQDQLGYLADQGCDEMQGFCYSRPLSAEQFAAFVNASGRRAAAALH